MLLLIVFTGYLIIYNVFQISVTNDIRFYGLLKTIGTTGRQIKALLRQQALLLSCIGIPIGLVLGWMVGGLLAPMVIQRLDGVVSTVSVHPLIFVGSALFALFTVLLSCAKPGRLAAKVSPIEAVRYTEGSQSKKKAKRGSGRVSPFSMARANLGRSKGKTVVTVLSLSLAVVLTTITATFVGGFDMDKYLSKSICTDFVLADAGHFQVGDTFHAGMALPQEVIDQVTSQGGVARGGKGLWNDDRSTGGRDGGLVPFCQPAVVYRGANGELDYGHGTGCWEPPAGQSTALWHGRLCLGSAGRDGRGPVQAV